MNLIFLIVGPPAVGKSTTSRALAARLPKSIHIPVDTIRDMVVSGIALPGAEWSAELAQQVALARRSVVHMALSYQEAGFGVVIDDFWDPEGLADYRALFSQPGLLRVILFPRQEQAHQRNRQRSGENAGRDYIDQGIQIVYQHLRDNIARLTKEGWLVVDSTYLRVEQTVDAILEQTGSGKPKPD